MSPSRRQPSQARTVTRSTHEFLRFVLIGAGAAGCYVLLATLLDVFLGVPRALASAVAYGAMVLPAYAAQRFLTFRSTASHLQAFPRYLAAQFAALSVASIVSASISGVVAPLTYGIAGAAGALVTYCLLKFWGFSERA